MDGAESCHTYTFRHFSLYITYILFYTRSFFGRSSSLYASIFYYPDISLANALHFFCTTELCFCRCNFHNDLSLCVCATPMLHKPMLNMAVQNGCTNSFFIYPVKSVHMNLLSLRVNVAGVSYVSNNIESFASHICFLSMLLKKQPIEEVRL